MSTRDFPLQNACGCCAGVAARSPVVIQNRPGLSAIAYRIGNHSDVLASLLARLSSKQYKALARLRTRDSDDFTIALLDAFSGMADVLSFYQERIANESYLRTAGERFSLQEMARLIAYRLNPGVAAETWLAFTVEETTGAPAKVRLDSGTQVRSVPGQDEKPQVFETVEQIVARPEWNLLKPEISRMIVPSSGSKVIYLEGTGTQLSPGDPLLFVGSEKEGDSGSAHWDFRRIQSLVSDSKAGRTAVTLEESLGPTTAANPEVYALRLRASLFGHNAPDWRIMSDEIKRGYLGLGSTDPIVAAQWPGFTIAGISDPPGASATGTGLYGEYFNTKSLTQRKLSRTDSTVNFDWGSGSPDPSIGTGTFSVRWTGWLQAPSSGSYSFHTLSDDGVRLWVNGTLVINNWTNHAATENSGSISLTAGEKYDIKLEFYENTGAAVIKLFWTPPGQGKQIIPQQRLYPRDVHTLHLDAMYPQIVPEGWLVMSAPGQEELYRVESAGEDSRASFTLTGKTTRLVVKGVNLRQHFNERLRETAIFAHSEKLALAKAPVSGDVSGATLSLDRKVQGLQADRKLILTGETTEGEKASEVLTLLRTEADGAVTRLVFTGEMQNDYKRESVGLYANAALAGHGETVHQILGNGDAGRSHQKFQLKHAPLTHVRADNESGAETALEVRVNDVAWHEERTLFESEANDHSYVVRVDEDGSARIAFGDGLRGARLPSGQENVRAIYRKGIGVDGNLAAGQLSQLMSRPLGLKAVSNPGASSGGVDAEDAEDARTNIPLGVRTLGRAVSLRDYEDFARAYTGIAKARAQVLDVHGIRTIFITVGGKNGSRPQRGGPTLNKLLASLRKSSDPHVACDAAPYNEAYFNLAVRIRRHADHEIDTVLTAVEKALHKAFSFGAREFGQAVARSEVISVAQQVTGVVAVDVDYFYRGTTPKLEDRLTPESASIDGNGDGVAAELLMLKPGALYYLEELT
jgi:hypothetical protein